MLQNGSVPWLFPGNFLYGIVANLLGHPRTQADDERAKTRVAKLGPHQAIVVFVVNRAHSIRTRHVKTQVANCAEFKIHIMTIKQTGEIVYASAEM